VILATALVACSGKSKGADIPALIADLKSADEETRGKANLALMDAGEAAVPALAEAARWDPVRPAAEAAIQKIQSRQ